MTDLAVSGGRSPSVPAPRVLYLEGSVVGPGQETAFIGKFIKQLKENPLFAELFEDIRLSTINQRKIKREDS